MGDGLRTDLPSEDRLRDDQLHAIERELMLLSRHHILPASNHRHGRRTLERSAYLLLSRIEVEGPMTLAQLAEAFSLDVSTVNRQTAAMVQAGLVERIPDPNGAMARRLAMTPEGRQRLQADRDIVLDALAKILTEWAGGDLRQLADVLGRFNLTCEREYDYVWPRPAPLSDH
ncbi:MarR family winged helix-turn-helix transcriptional regulator [Frankia sp. R82]|uniref:MarR family winged helix-turn-helix transcriptional regulator n=1 Tax=Frankia sp. R82 TaxID=2950553 RepID=UPI0035ABC15B|nr:MarR family transcriptional regulator [Frankia sp. R82]